jgi:hypothetical protein
MFIRRDSFRMQVTPGPDVIDEAEIGVPASPVGVAGTRTERLFGWTPPRAVQAVSSAPQTAGAKLPLLARLSRSAFAGVCLSAFACGILVTTAVDHWREQRSPAPAAQHEAPAAPSVTSSAPVRVPPAASLPAPTAPVAAVEPVAAVAEAPAVHAAPPAPPAASPRPARKRALAPAAKPHPPIAVTPPPALTTARPTTRKWVDPFAE